MRRRTMKLLTGFSLTAAAVFVAGSLPGIGNVQASPGVAATSMHSRVKRGEEVFGQRCVLCHNQQPGEASVAGGPPNLHGVFRGHSPLTTKQAKQIIMNGKGAMPGWANVLTGSDINDVIAYLKTQ